MNNKLKALCCLILIILFGMAGMTLAQQVRDTYRRVKPSVVEVRTLRKAVAPFPQESPAFEVGIGSGVLISDDGQVLTAAHVVQPADLILVVFADGNPIQAHVTHSAVYADVALLKLDRAPSGAVAAKLGDSDRSRSVTRFWSWDRPTASAPRSASGTSAVGTGRATSWWAPRGSSSCRRMPSSIAEIRAARCSTCQVRWWGSSAKS